MALKDLIKVLQDMLPPLNKLTGYEKQEFYFIREACDQLHKLDELEKIVGPDMSAEHLQKIVEQDKNGDVTIVQCRHKFAPLRLSYTCSDSFGVMAKEWVHPEVPNGMGLKYCVKCGAVFVDVKKGGGEHD